MTSIHEKSDFDTHQKSLPAEPIALPTAKRGRRNPAQQAQHEAQLSRLQSEPIGSVPQTAQQAQHEAQLSRFYDAILEINSRLEFPRRELRERFAAEIGLKVKP